jgi:hypothetical protein
MPGYTRDLKVVMSTVSSNYPNPHFNYFPRTFYHTALFAACTFKSVTVSPVFSLSDICTSPLNASVTLYALYIPQVNNCAALLKEKKQGI